MPNTIKVKRGKSAALNTSTEKLQAGEILYNLDKNYLTVGAEDNDALTKKPVAAREIVGYTGDTDSKIGASTTEAYSIKYDTQLKIKDGDNTLLVPKKNGTLATTEDITASASTKLDNTNEDKIALKNNRSLSYTSDATASTVMSRDANGRAKVADGAAAQDIATVGQLNTGLNAKVTKPVNPTVDSAITIDSSGAISTKSLASITGKLEVAVSSAAPTEQSDEILWINPNGTSGGGGSGGGGGKLYLHLVRVEDQRDYTGIVMSFYTSSNIEFTPATFKEYFREYYNFLGITGKGNHQSEYYPSYAYIDTYSGPAHDNDVITYYAIVDGQGSERTLVLSEFKSYGMFYDTVTEL